MKRLGALRSRVVFGLALFGAAASGCRGCGKHDERRTSPWIAPTQCSSAADCAGSDPCVQPACVDERCSFQVAAKGTSCDDGNVCNGIATCDGQGRCSAGIPPVVDDGNACTIDTCDPVRGVEHQPIPVDDFDACTRDDCDPKTGVIRHDTLVVDDGDPCTVDSCDPKTGVQHRQPDSFYACGVTCRAGFHAISRTASRECGEPDGVRSFCVPDCGESFYSCDLACPAGFHAASVSVNAQCGTTSVPQRFCLKDSGDSFYTCDARCPKGYRQRSEMKSAQCGSAPMIGCARE